MPDEHYIDPKLASLYDLDSGWSDDRDFYLALADGRKRAILDLGCGTGLLCNAYAEKGHDVTGVDPAPAMLEIARQKEHGEAIHWIQSTAQAFQPDQFFDLIIMTGHAFQVLLEDADVLKVFSTVKRCLKPGGQFVFESRNPNFDWSEEWNYRMELESEYGRVIETREMISFKGSVMQFELNYTFPDEMLKSHSELRFWSFEEIKHFIATSGLSLTQVVGDWDRSPYDAELSKEMIFSAQYAENKRLISA